MRTLIEWSLCRQEHVGHHVLLAACKDEIYIRQKLDVGAQQGLCATFGIFGYLLELVYGNIDSFLRLFQILEDMFKRIFALTWRNRNRERWDTCHLIKRHRRLVASKEGGNLAHGSLRESVDLPDNRLCQ